MEENISKMIEEIKNYKTQVINLKSVLSTKECKINELLREKDVIHKREFEFQAIIESLKKEKDKALEEIKCVKKMNSRLQYKLACQQTTHDEEKKKMKEKMDNSNNIINELQEKIKAMEPTHYLRGRNKNEQKPKAHETSQTFNTRRPRGRPPGKSKKQPAAHTPSIDAPKGVLIADDFQKLLLESDVAKKTSNKMR